MICQTIYGDEYLNEKEYQINKEAFKDSVLNPRPGIVKQRQTSTQQHHWQTIIKVAAYRHRRTRRYGYAFEAIDLEGTRLFIGASTSGRQSICSSRISGGNSGSHDQSKGSQSKQAHHFDQ
ncbi:hypothetical protein SO802_016907 [Lithocarpus litseifolius]|uniref:Uncharacterized protein n=1 Tax=Lithocarpus litseifolius TaxID=425828 RepID=A0AAW2D379_9ROSI